jgi:hypothetical protein
MFPFFRFDIDVAIITQKYLSFQRILKRSAFASHSICIENIVDLISTCRWSCLKLVNCFSLSFQLQYNLTMFICLSWIVSFFLFNIDVAIITQQYLSFHRILKRSAFASHSFCIENIVDLIILDLPIKLPKAGKVYLSIFFNAGVSTWT